MYIHVMTFAKCFDIKYFMQVASPPQQTDASVDALYSLVASVKSSGDIHEVYIDAHFRNTALKVK